MTICPFVPGGKHCRCQPDEGIECMEFADLRRYLETARRNERANEDQLVRIARCVGRDATGAPEHDRTIAGATIAELERLRAAIAFALPMAEEEWGGGLRYNTNGAKAIALMREALGPNMR
jgi:hypothetical protein